MNAHNKCNNSDDSNSKYKWKTIENTNYNNNHKGMFKYQGQYFITEKHRKNNMSSVFRSTVYRFQSR